jgi:phenylacetate-CoA ligase
VNRLLKIYHRLPAPAQSVAATLRGMYLRYWRGSEHSSRQSHEALQRDYWTPEQWDAWRSERLAVVLQRAATLVPFYRDYWAARRRRGDTTSWRELENWPLLEKDAVREEPRRFVADDCRIQRMFHEQTSGTTGKPLEMWRTRQTVRALYAVVQARTRMWNGVPAGARYARLGGQLVTPVSRRQPPFWVWNAAMGQLYMSTYHLAPDLIPSYLQALVDYRIGFLTGYPSSLTAIAYEVLRSGRDDLRMQAVFTNAEPVTPQQRAILSQAFQCPVRESYGQAEAVAFASECPGGRLHQWPEVGHIEVQSDGELVCTGLLNADMPLIRYRVGDRAAVGTNDERCSCGRLLPLMSAIDGRISDSLVTRDGRSVFWLNPVFYGLPVRQAQIEQETFDRLLVRAVPGAEFGAETQQIIIERLRSRMGEIDVTVHAVDEIPRTAAGKVPAVVCRIPLHQRGGQFTGGIAP